MWTHPATRANVARLRDDFGYRIVEPETRAARVGPVRRRPARRARRDRGRGRRGRRPIARSARPTPPRGRRSSRRPARPTSTGRHVVVTAGGTREPIDPVRFIGNRSTGRMGVAIAEAALARGARVTLDRRPASRSRSRPSATVVRAESTAEMRAALLVDAVGRRRGRLRRPGHGRRRRRLPAGRAGRREARRAATA